jgi:PAS domain S-box-containing protein
VILGLLVGGGAFLSNRHLPSPLQDYAPFLIGLLVVLASGPLYTGLVDHPLRRTLHDEKIAHDALLMNLHEGVLILNAKHEVEFVNPAAARLFGFDPAELTGQAFDGLLADGNEQNLADNGHTLQRGRSEAQGRQKDGTPLALELSVSEAAIPDSGRLVVLARDIAERKQEQQELRNREERKAAILESAIDCIITLDAKGRVAEVNSAVEKILGYQRAEMMGKRLAELIFPPSMDDRNSSRVWQNFATVGGFVLGKPIAVTAMRANRTEFPAELVVGSLNLQGNLMYTASLRDVTRQKRLEQHKNILQTVTALLGEGSAWSSVAPRLLQALAEALEWNAAVLWEVDAKHNALRCAQQWQAAPAQPAFAAAHAQCVLAPGSGLAGRVWTRQEASWITDIQKESSFAGGLLAGKFGLHGACAFPIAWAGQMPGVIEVFSRSPQPLSKDLLGALSAVGVQMGQYLDQRRTAEALREAEACLRQLAEVERSSPKESCPGSQPAGELAEASQKPLLTLEEPPYCERPLPRRVPATVTS